MTSPTSKVGGGGGLFTVSPDVCKHGNFIKISAQRRIHFALICLLKGEASGGNTTHNMAKTATLTEKLVFGFRYFSDGLAAMSVLLSYEAEKAAKHLSRCSEL